MNGTGGLGGALATPGQAGALVALYSLTGARAFVKSGSYSIGNAMSNVSGGTLLWPAAAASPQRTGFIIGYGAVRGDYGPAPTLTLTANNPTATIIAAAGATNLPGAYIANLTITNAATGTMSSVTGVSTTSGSGAILFKLRVLGCNNNGIHHADGKSVVVLCEVTGSSGQPAGVGGQWYFCAIHDNTGGGLVLGDTGNVVAYSLVTNNSGGSTGDGIHFQGSNTAGGLAMGNTLYNNAGAGIKTIAGTVPVVLLNNLSVGNGGMNYDAAGQTDAVIMVRNAWFGGGGGIGGNLPASKAIGTIALTSSPFVDAAGNNFALNTTPGGGAAVTAAGIGSPALLIPGVGTISYLDIGAAQIPANPLLPSQIMALVDQVRQTGQFTVTAQTINFGKPVTSTTMVNAIYDWAVYGGLLWAGGRYTSSNNACLFSSPDGVSWTDQTARVGFATTDAEVRTLFASADGNLYLGTTSTSPGAVGPNIFSFDASSWTLQTSSSHMPANPISMTQVNVRSFGDGPDGLVYATTTPYVTMPIPMNAPQLWNGGGSVPAKWAQVLGTPWTASITRLILSSIPGPTMYASTDKGESVGVGGVFKSTTPGSGTSCGAPINTTSFSTPGGAGGGVEVHKLARFKGQFYASTHDINNGASVWVSSDQGVTWTQIASTAFGFGIGVTEEEAYHLYVYDDTLFVGTLNKTFGAGIWFTQNGLDWYRIGTPGMGDPLNNSGYYHLVAFQNRLWVAPHGSSVSSPNVSRPYSIERFADTGRQAAGGAGLR
jgi:hypothetical protein